MSYSVVTSPDAESDLVVILSILEANDIPYFVHGGGMSGLWPGLQISSVNARRVMVPTEYAAAAREALAVLLEEPEPELVPAPASPPSRFLESLRVLVEFFCFGLFVPRHRSSFSRDNPGQIEA
jgi:hypothetical protein